MQSQPLTYTATIPVIAEVDVLVVGGGPAGIAAAVGAARSGARTMLVERYGFLGGTATASLVGPFMTSFSDDGEVQLVKGVFDELVRRMADFGGAVHPAEVAEGGGPYSGFFTKGHAHVTPFDPEALKLVAAELILEVGVSLRLHTFFVDVLRGENGIDALVLASKNGLHAVRARQYVDCSGDGDVAFAFGADMAYGRHADGKVQPMTMFFRVGGVDDTRFEQYVAEHPEEKGAMLRGLIAEKRAAGEWTLDKSHLSLFKTPQHGVWRVNTTRVRDVDGRDAGDLTRAEIEGRRQVVEIMRFIGNYVPGFEQAFLLDTATQIGVRETRRLVGKYTLTTADLESGRDFDDAIAMYGYPIDIHSPVDGSSEFDGRFRTANAYQIPFGILVPRTTQQLLVAGRCVSATHEALGAVRVMPCAFAMGHAAGIAAALAATSGAQPGELDVRAIQRRLSEQGAVLPRPCRIGG